VYKVSGNLKNKQVSKLFDTLYDAIDYRDTLDAQYASSVSLDKLNIWSPITMYKLIMDENHNPLKKLPKPSAHAIMQTLALMWSIVFGVYLSSFTAFGLSATAHVLFILAIVYTYGIFNGAQSHAHFSLRPGYHSVSRTRGHMWINGKKIMLDPNDPGGEHE